MAMDYLTRIKKVKPDLPDVFPASRAPIPPIKPEIEQREAINAFIRRQQKAGGGMLVQPGFGGVRQGYGGPKKAGAGYEKRMKVKNYLKDLPKKSNINILDLADELKVGRGLIDDLLKEFKNKKFNLIRRVGFLNDKEFAKEYKKFQESDFFKIGQDSEFADYLNDAGFKPASGDKFTSNNVKGRRNSLGIKNVASKFAPLSDKEILKEAKRLDIKNIKDLSAAELRSKVIRARSLETIRKKLKEDPFFRKEFKEKARKVEKRYKKRLMSTEEGRAKLLAQRRKDKRAEYKRKGIDPLGTNADEALWRDAVITANNNIDGKGRFSISSGYSKSMDAKDYYGNKIKIKDNQTGKIFNYNNFKNYINKNAASFRLKNYDEAVKPYRQKFFINDRPNLRTSINFALIPNYNEGSKLSAYTIQHDFGRQRNPLKTSLAYFDDNKQEYRIRSDFEEAWERSKKSKTPLTDRKKAFNVFKKDLANLNIQSVPSMVQRERFFGKGLDLTDILKTAKKEGAVLPRGVLKEAAEFDKQIIKSIAVLGGGNCGRIVKYQGGRVGLQDGTPNVDVCFRNAVNRINQGLPGATAAEARNFTKVLRLGRNILKFGILPEALFISAESLFRVGLGDSPKEALLRASEYILPGDQTDRAEVLKVARTKGPENAAIVERALKYKSELGNIQNLESELESADILSPTSEFDYLPDRTKEKKDIEQRILEQKQNLTKINEAQLKGAERIQQEAFDISKAKSPLTKLQSFAKDLEYDDPLSSDFQRPQQIVDTNLFPSFRDLMKERVNVADIPERDIRAYFTQNPEEGNAEDFIDSQNFLKSLTSFSEAEKFVNPEELYGASGLFFGQPIMKTQPPVRNTSQDIDPFQAAGGGIAKLAGVDSGPPPASGPNSQGLQGLMKRVKRI